MGFVLTRTKSASAEDCVRILEVVMPDELRSSLEVGQQRFQVGQVGDVGRKDEGVRPRAVVEAVCKPVGFFYSGASPEDVAHETDVGRTACRCTCVLHS